MARLEDLTNLSAAPTFLCSDNGPGFIAKDLRGWRQASRTNSTTTIEPGPVWEGDISESDEIRSTASPTAGAEMGCSTQR
jgi:hypothetical protein